MQTQGLATATTGMTGVSTRVRLGGWCGMVAGPLWVGVVAVLTVAEYGFLTHAGWSFLGDNKIPYPSYTARGQFGIVQTLNFAVTGVLVLLFVGGLATLLRRWTGLVGRVLLTVTGVAMVTSAFTTDRVPGPATWHGTVHALSFFAIVLSSTLGLLFAGLALRRTPGWRAWGTTTALLGPWQFILFTFGGGLLPGEVAFYVFVLTLFGWIAATGRRLLGSRVAG
ncbi:MAG TPA: DUF998 domain-containing protein [Nocardioidaceae bacterium]|nr:DUF998 domain-containing protein [Nocardioidaceae bacterium]